MSDPQMSDDRPDDCPRFQISESGLEAHEDHVALKMVPDRTFPIFRQHKHKQRFI